MIARINFTGTLIPSGTKLNDYVDIHAASVAQAKAIFLDWTSHGIGLKGNLAFHPLAPYGMVKVKNVVEQSKIEE